MNLDLLNDNTRQNLAQLDVAQVDWVLKQFVACLRLTSPCRRSRRFIAMVGRFTS